LKSNGICTTESSHLCGVICGHCKAGTQDGAQEDNNSSNVADGEKQLPQVRKIPDHDEEVPERLPQPELDNTKIQHMSGEFAFKDHGFF
jgi:hypothetical protein